MSAAPGPVRHGPEPIGLHLTAATLRYWSSLSACMLSSGGSLSWSPELAARAAAFTRASAVAHDADPLAVPRAVEQAARDRLALFLRGVRRYRRHRAVRLPAEPPTLWREGAMRLLDYGASDLAARGGPVLLLVPSLINRAYVMDLATGRSFARALAAAGWRPLLVDWGAPGPAEQGFATADYVARRLAPALSIAAALGRGGCGVIGYCLGGLLALGAARARPDLVRFLVLLASPWDFHRVPGWARRARAGAPMLDRVISALGQAPPELVHLLTFGIDPFRALAKFERLARDDDATIERSLFVELEDWANDGVALTAEVAREVLIDWHGANAPMLGAWSALPGPRPLDGLGMPILAVVPEHDKIVPAVSALALAGAAPHAQFLMPRLGHVGMMSSTRAPKLVWQPLAAWMAANAP